ncbi:MAG TPA: DUF6807 family protein [Vicinamibacterales bacterium]|jgi:hypothetical protein|nr:DUF6807 family protein [Vicinamibacterales bacterium]
MHRFVLSVLMVLVAAAPAFAQVRIDVAEGRIAVSVDGRLFTALNTDMRVRKLYLDPVLTGSGKRVTRAFPMESVDGESTDHPHQRGIWIGAERVSGVDFWENVTERGPIRGGAFHELRASFAAYIPDSAVPLETSVQVVRPNFSTEGFSGTNWVRARSFQAGELLTIRRGRYDLRLGGEIGYLRARDYSYTPLGTYTYAPGPPQAGEHPLTYTQTFGAADLTYDQVQSTAFVQDKIQLSPRANRRCGDGDRTPRPRGAGALRGCGDRTRGQGCTHSRMGR